MFALFIMAGTRSKRFSVPAENLDPDNDSISSTHSTLSVSSDSSEGSPCLQPEMQKKPPLKRTIDAVQHCVQESGAGGRRENPSGTLQWLSPWLFENFNSFIITVL